MTTAHYHVPRFDADECLADHIHTLQRQIQNLRRTRDLLLPRLLSGQVNLKSEEVQA